MDILKSSTLRTRRYRDRLKAKGEQNKRDLAKEREARRHKSALSKGFASWDEYQAFKAQTKKPKQLPKKRVTGHDGVCWLWERPGISSAEKFSARYRLDDEFRLKERLRRQITKRVKKDGIGDSIRGALRRAGESNVVQRLLGYKIADLRKHLELQFLPGMGWHNMHEWHIDHIIPQSSFNLGDHDQWLKCWCMSNLRPLWARDNLAKSARVLTLL